MAPRENGAASGAAQRLRRIESVTDVSLALLDVEDLLFELMVRVREVLEVDTAAVLLLDHASGELVATAAVGLEEEVRQGVRVPLGVGFAGRVAAEAAPIVLHDVAHAEVHNPILLEKRIDSLLGVPLLAEGRVIGVIHVGSLMPRSFGRDDTEMLQLVANRVALAVEARRSNIEQAAAGALQRSLIPSRLPAVPGLELSARYLPARDGGVGGDWYDVFTLPGGRLGVVMGDVVGRGLAAAVVMGRLRSALRAYALDALDPSEVLERLDRKLQHFEPGQMTTVLYGVFDPSHGRVDVSSAGHVLPIVAVPGSAARVIDAPVDWPLGLTTDGRRRSTVVELPPGAALALFTDGLIERRGESLDVGIGRLRSVVGTDTAERSCRAAIAALLPPGGWHDDAALLVIRRDEQADQAPLHLVVPALPRSLEQVRTTLRRRLAALEVGEDKAIDVLLAVGEAVANAVEHAYGPTGGTVEIDVSPGPPASPSLTVTVRDTGGWRSPRGEDRGRGLLIMQQCADDVAIDRTATGTAVRLRFDVGKVAEAANPAQP